MQHAAPVSLRSRGRSRLLVGALFTLALSASATSGCSGDDDDTATAGSGGALTTGGTASKSNGGSSGTGGTSNSKGGSGNATAGKAGASGKGGSSSATGGTGGGADSGAGGTRAGSGSGGSSGGGSSGKASGGNGAGTGGSSGTGSGKGTAADVARALGREPNFLIGMGNDLASDHNQDGAYTLGVTLDLHYAYLAGLQGENGWPDWNPDGSFVNILTDVADSKGVTPMFDLYAMASRGEANMTALGTDEFMTGYWVSLKLLFQRLGIFDKPALVHLEPDFWAFAQQQAGGDPSTIPVRISGLATECAGQPEDLAGLGHCMLILARMYAPKTLIAFHASAWAGSPSDTVNFLTAIGAGDSDIIGMDMLDRDAGCFEVHVDDSCQRDDGPWYWDETNQTSPNFHEYIAKSKEVGDGLGLPILWWQIPFGVPSDEPGEAGAYRDNRVHYIFSHIQEFIDAGGVGAAFGVGAANQTYITSDGGQFQDAVTAYYANPVALP